MNSVELELLKIDKQWYRQVKENADVRLFVCLGEKHTLKLFDGYFRSHGAEEVETKDLFLVHYRPFEDALQYGHTLIEDLQLAYGLWREEHTSSVGCSAWLPDTDDGNHNL